MSGAAAHAARATSAFAMALVAIVVSAPHAHALEVYEESARLKAKLAPVVNSDPILSEPAFELAYSVNSNLNEARTARRYVNGLEAFASVNLLKTVYIYAGANMRYVALDNAVVLDNDGPAFGDLSLGALKQTRIGERHSLLAMASVDAPTSLASRREGYRAYSQVFSRLTSSLYDGWFSIENSVGLGHLANEFELSPTTLEVNPDWSAFYVLGFLVSPVKGLRVGLSAGAKSAHFIDGSNQMAFNNAFLIRYVSGSWTARIAFVAGDWIDRRNLDFWYIDRYRQDVTARIGYAF